MFTKGTEWIRADFHLHTKADKEFVYSGEDDRFVSDYVEKLKEEKINLGVITNHNKFDILEYNGIRKKAKQNDIIILPGVELSVKEGANGIHCLIVFKPEDWINGNSENINQFLDEVFKGIDNREHENTRCNKDLLGTIESLNSYEKDYFIIMAHVEQKSGFFEECDGGLIKSLSNKNSFKEKVLGFQKGRSRDKMKQLEEWMDYSLPYIEGSDCKSINHIGKGEKSFIKIGDGNFDSVNLAFKNFHNRISLAPKKFHHGYIKSMEFKGGKMNGQKIDLSQELNNLIGIRGSGKSSIIEVIRYALDLSISQNDEQYKGDVVKNLLESGGQVLLTVQDNFQHQYKIKRTWGEQPHVLGEDDNVTGAKISSILHSPLYFGQKDLSSMEQGFELDLLDKLVGNKIKDAKSKKDKVDNQIIANTKSLFDSNEKIISVNELHKSLEDIKHKISIFEEKGVADKLSKQVSFEKDKSLVKEIINNIDEFIKSINQLITSRELSELEEIRDTESELLPCIFKKINEEISRVLEVKDELEKIKNQVDGSSNKIKKHEEKIHDIIDAHEEDFAKIKREIKIPNLNPDDFSKLKNEEDKIQSSIQKATDEETEKNNIENRLEALVEERNETLLEEFKVYKDEIEKINNNQSSLELSIEFKGNKKYFINELRKAFKGSNVNTHGYQEISENFSDFTAFLIDIILRDSEITSSIITEAQLSRAI